MIGAILQELVEEVAIGAMDFHSVEAGGLRIPRAFAVCFDDAGNLADFQGPRDNEWALRAQQTDVSAGCDGARRDGQPAAEVAGIGDTADVPKLEEHSSARRMHSLGDDSPALDLLGRPDAGRIRIAHAARVHGGGLAEDQTSRRALHIVVAHQRIGDAAGAGTTTRQRRHEDAVGELQVADADWFQESQWFSHVDSSLCRFH